MEKVKLLDCTLRDGGYYNSWDFDISLVEDYLIAMKEISVDFVELGLRSFSKLGFKGAFAYTTDDFIRNLRVPKELKLGVMINASELVNHKDGVIGALEKLFVPADESPIVLVRVACHVYEFEDALPAIKWLNKNGYLVGFNVMQIADRSEKEIEELASLANDYPLDVLYFADSMGQLNPEKTLKIIKTIRKVWLGPLGIHAHDNMGFALANSMCGVDENVTWIDGTVTGMGRGPGNAKTEYLAIELDDFRKSPLRMIPLMEIIKDSFTPIQRRYGWGTNPYYYLSGKYGIHPTYIQEMLNDSRYNEEDILAVIEHLKLEGGKKYSNNTLEASRNFYSGKPNGTWNPVNDMEDKEVLIIGTGPSVEKHRHAIENYIKRICPYVIALNTQSQIDSTLINVHAACHPVRLLADANIHLELSQPLVTPLSMLSNNLVAILEGKTTYDFGMSIQRNKFIFKENYCILPNSLVITYALGIATSGKASSITLAGFDGYGSDDPRSSEVNTLLYNYEQVVNTPELIAITPTEYNIKATSVYAI